MPGPAVITSLVVWGAIPFVAITLYAGLTQVPRELVEAATVDGARPWRVVPRHHAADPEADLVIVTRLSVIWDFQVFTQVWVMRDSQPRDDYYVMASTPTRSRSARASTGSARRSRS